MNQPQNITFDKIKLSGWTMYVNAEFPSKTIETLIAPENFNGVRGPFKEVPASKYARVYKGEISFKGKTHILYIKQFLYRSVIDFMRNHQDAPFFLTMAWGPPHMPYKPPAGYDRVTAEDIIWRENVPEAKRSEKRTVNQLTGYYGLCEALDDAMGRVLDFLDESGLAENTLVLFTSDHGDCHGSHGPVFLPGHRDVTQFAGSFSR